MPCLNDITNTNANTNGNQLFLPLVRNRIKYFHEQQFYLEQLDQQIATIRSKLSDLELRKYENIQKRKAANNNNNNIESKQQHQQQQQLTTNTPIKRKRTIVKKQSVNPPLPSAVSPTTIATTTTVLPLPISNEREWIDLTRQISKLNDELRSYEKESIKVRSCENELIWTQRMLPLLHDFYKIEQEQQDSYDLPLTTTATATSKSPSSSSSHHTRETILNEYIDRCERDFMTNEQRLLRTQKQTKLPIKQKRRKLNNGNLNYDESLAIQDLSQSLIGSNNNNSNNANRSAAAGKAPALRSHWCYRCHRESLVAVDSESILVCIQCARIVRDLATNDRGFNYNEAPDKIANIYQRRTHFRDKLNSIQGRQQRKIPLEFEEKIKTQLRIETINFKDVTRIHIRRAIKSLGRDYKDWYEYDTMIACKISGRPCLRFSAAQEAILYRDFEAIQRPYDECPWKYHLDKDNFMNYNFTIFKIVQRHGWTEFLEDITLLKSPTKLAELQTIWNYICNRLKWLPVIQSCNVRPKPSLMQLVELRKQEQEQQQQQLQSDLQNAIAIKPYC